MFSSNKVIGLPKKQTGITLLIFVLLVVIVSSSVMLSVMSSNNVRNERDKKTATALAEAKAALIGFAVSINLSNEDCTAPNNNCARLGDFLCPDMDDDGDAEGSCGNTSGSTGQADRIGRLPWKTLGLPDLRDGNGDRLWYALSNNFKNNFRTRCMTSGESGCLNSDTVGTITLRNSAGTIINNANAGSGVVAVVFSPGTPLTREDGVVQDRGCAGCSTNPINYLDNLESVDDNASFVDGSAADGLIKGPILDEDGATIINDNLLAITTEELMPVLEKRVSIEVLNCLKDYALKNPGGVGRYPWTTNGAGTYPSFADSTEHRLGRIPDTLFTNTQASSAGYMSNTWPTTLPTACKIYSSSGWWVNWKELVFYAVAWDRDPASNFPVPNCGDEPGVKDCLTVATPTATQTNQSVVVMVAGKVLTSLGQSRSTTAQKRLISNYLEGDNFTSSATTRNPNNEDAVFEKGISSSMFNDVVVSY